MADSIQKTAIRVGDRVVSVPAKKCAPFGRWFLKLQQRVVTARVRSFDSCAKCAQLLGVVGSVIEDIIAEPNATEELTGAGPRDSCAHSVASRGYS